MASVILRSIGAAAGNAILPGIGGAFLGAIGGGIGGAIDGKLGLGDHVTGPRLDNLSVQDSRYGAGIPIVYGRARVAGNVIWSTDLIETRHDSQVSGGKGGLISGPSVSTTTYTYSVHCAVGVALGPVGGIAAIWADSKVIYRNGVWTSGVVDGASIYTGSSSQTPDAFMQSLLGSANVPAWRGLAYVVFENLQLANFGNRLPNLTFEIAPSVTTSNPDVTGLITNTGIASTSSAAAGGGLKPIVLSSGGSDVRTALVGGYAVTGATAVFEAVEYDVTGDAPLELARTQSAAFGASYPTDCSWAMGPDGRFVAVYLFDANTSAHFFALYDSANRQFGSVISASLALSPSGLKQIGWLDSQHIVMDDASGGRRGVRVFARAGTGLADLGFFDVWGAGSSSTRLPYGYIQYLPYAGGLLNLMVNSAVGTYFSAIYARTLSWRNNGVAAGAAYTIASGLSTGTGSGPHANLLATGDGEWTLCLGTAVDYHLLSFVPGMTSSTLTRPWTQFTTSFGTGGSQAPVLYGDRLLIVQRSLYENNYRLSEVMLGAGAFSLALDAVPVANNNAVGLSYGAIALDGWRVLVRGGGGTSGNQPLTILRRSPTGYGLDAVAGDILSRAGYAGGDYDLSALSGTAVNGYVLQEPMTARAALEPLQVFSPFDLVESEGQLRAVPRHGAPDIVIDAGEWSAATEGQDPPPPLDILRAQELDLPREIVLDYIDPARDFEVNSQRARRGVTRALCVQKVNLPVVCSASAAKRIAEARLFTLWAERDLARLKVSRRWMALDPGDVIDLGDGRLVRVTNIHQNGGLMEVTGFFVTASSYESAAAADSGQGSAAALAPPPDSALYLMDLPLLQAADDQPGVYAAAAGLPGWTGASLWRSADGADYGRIASLSAAAVAGSAVNVLADGPCRYMDRANGVTVQVIDGYLSSCGEAELFGGANAALLGDEIIQFQTATLLGPGLYALSNLLRGRRGTESAAASHAAGERFVMLGSGAVVFVPALASDRGVSYDFRALTKGQSLGDAQDTVFAYGLATLRPFAPVNITGARASGTGSDLVLTWARRARLDAEWVSYVDVPLDEPSELYEAEIMNGGSVVRTFTGLAAPTLTYAAAQQTADWGGSVPSSFTVNIYQISARYGRGAAGVATV